MSTDKQCRPYSLLPRNKNGLASAKALTPSNWNIINSFLCLSLGDNFLYTNRKNWCTVMNFPLNDFCSTCACISVGYRPINGSLGSWVGACSVSIPDVSLYSCWETFESVTLPSTLETDCMYNFIDCLDLFFSSQSLHLLKYLFGKEDMVLKIDLHSGREGLRSDKR